MVFSYKASNKKDYLIILPLLYSFVGLLWVALGFLDKDLSDAYWYIKDEHIIKTYFIFIISSVSFYLGLIPTLSKNKSVNLCFKKDRDLLNSNEQLEIVLKYLNEISLHLALNGEFDFFKKRL